MRSQLNHNAAAGATLLWWLSALTLAVWSTGCSTTRPPAPLDYRLPLPASESARVYLGLSTNSPSFQLNDIQGDLLVVDCFDMYCHICQVSAKHVNELYAAVQEHELGGRVRFIGLGVGDTPLEVATYKRKLNVPFPVFPDRRSAVAKSLGPLALPNLLVLRRENGQFKVIHRSPGQLREPNRLFSIIQAGLAQSQSQYQTDALQGAEPTCHGSSTCRRSLFRGGAEQIQ